MARSKNSGLTYRINETLLLLKKKLPCSQITTELIDRFGVSKVQAYRYIRAAQKNKRIVPIPEEKSVFTVKLPQSIIQRIKGFAKSGGISISEVVKQALEEFLRKRAHG